MMTRRLDLLIALGSSLLPAGARANKKTALVLSPQRVAAIARSQITAESQRVSAISPDGSWLARVEKPGVIALWEVQPTARDRRQRRPRRILKLSPTPAADAAIRLRFARTNAASKHGLLLVAFAYDPSNYAVGEGYGSVRDRLSVWRIRDGKRLLSVRPPLAPSRGKAAVAQLFDWTVDDGGRLLAVSFDGSVVVYDLSAKPKQRCAIAVGLDGVETEPAIALSPDGRQLALVEPSGTNVDVYDMSKHNGRRRPSCGRLASHSLPTCKRTKSNACNGGPFLAYSRSGLVVADGVGLLIRNPGQSKSSRSVFDDRRFVSGAKFAPAYVLIGGRTLRLRSRQGRLIERDLETRKWRQVSVELPANGKWSPDGRWYLFARDSTLGLLALDSSKRYRLIGIKATDSIRTAFVKGKRLLVVAHSGQTIASWEPPR